MTDTRVTDGKIDLTKSFAQYCIVKEIGGGDDNTSRFVTGIASDSSIDEHNQIIAPGAFTKSIAESKRLGIAIPLKANHGVPIGLIKELEDTPNGLRIRAELAEGNQAADDAFALLKQGVYRFFSVGLAFRDIDEFLNNTSLDLETGVLTILEAMLDEASLVYNPANRKAAVQEYKSLLIGEKSNIKRSEKSFFEQCAERYVVKHNSGKDRFLQQCAERYSQNKKEQ